MLALVLLRLRNASRTKSNYALHYGCMKATELRIKPFCKVSHVLLHGTSQNVIQAIQTFGIVKHRHKIRCKPCCMVAAKLIICLPASKNHIQHTWNHLKHSKVASNIILNATFLKNVQEHLSYCYKRYRNSTQRVITPRSLPQQAQMRVPPFARLISIVLPAWSGMCFSGATPHVLQPFSCFFSVLNFWS